MQVKIFDMRDVALMEKYINKFCIGKDIIEMRVDTKDVSAVIFYNEVK